ncbi:16S rRNA (guanine(527)-N(7))-methyltransferase RsmG [Aurantimonas sp. 22II-16-19i]|uniref:16S rRNA (guanine(527)-N(7))-methyltransferase RsmG n=1 Tax=Aurantimonas sp. 22II-16-19i TaxID=1317114 RepID=UPI0009F7C2C2|nr:16S rRNA (guanine(527)-N(7))-methyltransferase RsmG [Aurantimonas sp. 22II-16-19i]ORE92046.1 16S rRNA methyltransferase GidB [Aurantimonas sp. 22II-16-19i]
MRRDKPKRIHPSDRQHVRSKGEDGNWGEHESTVLRPKRPNGPKKPAKAAPPSAADIAAQQAAGRAWFVEAFPVSRETMARLDGYVRLLTEWQARINLVAPSTLGDVWRRHVADAMGLDALLPDFGQAVDLGSGAGFPALVVAACRPSGAMDMVESSHKKAAFLATVLRELGLKGRAHPVRIEAAGDVLARADVITARALAPLDDLLAMVAPHVSRETRCFFPKGRSHEQEIAAAAANWQFTMVIHDSKVEADSVVLEVAGIEPRRS